LSLGWGRRERGDRLWRTKEVTAPSEDIQEGPPRPPATTTGSAGEGEVAALPTTTPVREPPLQPPPPVHANGEGGEGAAGNGG
jgi:hypothetical protein